MMKKIGLFIMAILSMAMVSCGHNNKENRAHTHNSIGSYRMIEGYPPTETSNGEFTRYECDICHEIVMNIDGELVRIEEEDIIIPKVELKESYYVNDQLCKLYEYKNENNFSIEEIRTFTNDEMISKLVKEYYNEIVQSIHLTAYTSDINNEDWYLDYGNYASIIFTQVYNEDGNFIEINYYKNINSLYWDESKVINGKIIESVDRSSPELKKTLYEYGSDYVIRRTYYYDSLDQIVHSEEVKSSEDGRWEYIKTTWYKDNKVHDSSTYFDDDSEIFTSYDSNGEVYNVQYRDKYTGLSVTTEYSMPNQAGKYTYKIEHHYEEDIEKFVKYYALVNNEWVEE